MKFSRKLAANILIKHSGVWPQVTSGRLVLVTTCPGNFTGQLLCELFYE